MVSILWFGKQKQIESRLLIFICLQRQQSYSQQINHIMGNEQCSQCKQSSPETQAYGSHELQKHQNEICAVVEKLVECHDNDNKLKDIVVRQLEQRQRIRSLHVVRLIRFLVKDQGYGFKAVMYYQYLPKTLRMRKQELEEKGQMFTECELFALIYGVQSGLQQLQKHNIKHNCLNLDTIMYKNNLYKITDVSSTTYLRSFDLVIKGDRQQFLSQKILDAIYNMCLSPSYDIRDDYFALGMIVLAVAVGKDAGYFYVWNGKGQGSLNVKNMEASLRAIQKQYSSKLVKKVKWLLYEADNSVISEQTNLTDDLMNLQEEMARVMQKAKKFNPKDAKTQNETTAGTPQKTLKMKARSFFTSPRFQ